MMGTSREMCCYSPFSFLKGEVCTLVGRQFFCNYLTAVPVTRKPDFAPFCLSVLACMYSAHGLAHSLPLLTSVRWMPGLRGMKMVTFILATTYSEAGPT